MNTNSKIALAVTADAALGFGSISAGHRFPPPWSVEEQDSCFVVRDHSGQALSYVYFKDDQGRRSVATARAPDKLPRADSSRGFAYLHFLASRDPGRPPAAASTINNKKRGTVADLAQSMENARGQATAIVKWPRYG